MSVVDKANINTEPGVPGSTFSPPANWIGGSQQFIDWVRNRYISDQAFRINIDAHVRFYQRYQDQVTISGPFLEEVQRIFAGVANRHQSGKDSLNTVAFAA